MGNRRTDATRRTALRKELRARGLPEVEVERQLEAFRQKQLRLRAGVPVDNRARQHMERRRLFRRRLEADGLPSHLVEVAVERLKAQQAAARRAGVALPDMEAIYEETWAALRLDDKGFKPTSSDSLLRGRARATGQTATAVRRGKTVTKHQHDKAPR